MTLLFKSFPFTSTCSPYQVELSRGKYLFELWGAQGGGVDGGKGGYTSGIISIFYPTTFYVFVGGKGSNGNINGGPKSDGGCNGGGKGGAGGFSGSLYCSSGAGGGGATDIRFNESSVDSRIIVAGGGGGVTYACGSLIPGYGGGIVAGPDPKLLKRANQTYGYDKGYGQNGRDGIISTSASCNAEGSGGGGGGYYGGFSYQNNEVRSNSAGGGGSSYISGHKDCEMYQDYIFRNSQILEGNKTFLSPLGIEEEGHSGDGHARIVFIDSIKICTNMQISRNFIFSFLYLFVLIKI